MAGYVFSEHDLDLVREQTLRDLWLGLPLPSSDEIASILGQFRTDGFLSPDGIPKLNDKGLEYVLHRQDIDSLDSLLRNLNLSDNERRFMAHVIAEVVDKPFAHQIMMAARDNPARNPYPSVDLGSFDDIAHGLLFGAKEHIMIDFALSEREIESVVRRLQSYGANVLGVVQRGSITNIDYQVEDDRKVRLVKADATRLDAQTRAELQRGVYALIVKGLGGYNGAGYGNVFEALEQNAQFLRDRGLILTPKPTTQLERLFSGILSYWSHVSQNYRFQKHTLYQKGH